MKKFLCIYFAILISLGNFPLNNDDILLSSDDVFLSDSVTEVQTDVADGTAEKTKEIQEISETEEIEPSISTEDTNTTESEIIFIPDEDISFGVTPNQDDNENTSYEATTDNIPFEELTSEDNLSNELNTSLLAAPAAKNQSISISPVTFHMGSISHESSFTFQGAAIITITSTKNNWSLSVSGTNFSNGENTITVERIKLKPSTSSNYITLKNTPIILLDKQRTSSATIIIDYEITLLPTDPAGVDFLSMITYTVN